MDMDQLYAYDRILNDFKLFENKDIWKNQITCDAAKSYMKNHLKESLIRDFQPALKAYKEDYEITKIGKGFFGLLRMVFPYITFLGGLYKGKDETKNSIVFMEDYMGMINPLYKDISDLIYNVYRHGLMHTNMPKVSEINGRYVSWEITFNDNNHLNINVEGNNITIPISPNRLFLDVVNSIGKYIDDFDNPVKNDELLENFIKGFIEMSRIHSESELKNKRKCIKGVDYIRTI